MKILFSLFLLFPAMFAQAEDVLTIVDAADSTPLAGTTVISSNGQIIGLTDDEGKISVSSTDLYPISFRSVGYEVSSIDASADTVRLGALPIILPEVNSSAADKPIRRVICYFREYLTSETDKETAQMYSQFMGECYVTDRDKVKGYKKGDASIKVRNVSQIVRVTNSNGADSICRPRPDDNVMSFATSFSEIPHGAVEETEAIVAGARADTVQGKYSPFNIYRKTDNFYLITTDVLGNHEGHHWSPTLFKLFGMTMDFNDVRLTSAYVVNSVGKYRIFDYAYSTVSISGIAKGKMFKWLLHTKEPVKVSCLIEIYPVEITSHSVEEYKELREEKNRIEFRKPDYTLPLPPSVKEMVERAKTELK